MSNYTLLQGNRNFKSPSIIKLVAIYKLVKYFSSKKRGILVCTCVTAIM